MNESQMYNQDVLSYLRSVVDNINETNSSKEKQERLAQVVKDATELQRYALEWALKQTYSPYIKFGVTSEQVKKWMKTKTGPELFAGDMGVDCLLAKLAKRNLTGHQALQTISDVLYWLPENLREVFYNILDKNLKIRMDAKSINKVIPNLIPVFEVSLCNVYADRKHKVDFEKDIWYASRKLDGCRCIAIADNDGIIRFFSRQGKEFFTLDRIKEQLASQGLQGVVLDGEMCIVDANGDEDFKAIMKEITRKDHTIQSPRYKVFDMMTLEEFQTQHTDRNFASRYTDLVEWGLNYYEACDEINAPQLVQVVEMIDVIDQKHFEDLFAAAQAKDWEGLVIRKNDTTICKRSDSMLKVKAFSDAEYVVEGTENGPFRVIKDGREVEEEVMTNAYITHKGNRVSVGSGWSLEQRRLYKEHPEMLVGKTITVQYFEETTDKSGNISLRFPTCKMVYEDGRDL